MVNKKNKNSKVNIYNVAKEVGVSVATISRFFNNESLVKESTKAKIVEVCSKYNYKPSKIARAITTRKTNSIAFIVPSLIEPAFIELINGAEFAMSQKGYSMTIFNTRQDIKRENDIIDTIDSMIIDGVIFSGVYGGEEEKVFISEVQKRNIPIILVDRVIPDLNVPFVMSNDYLGGSLAAKFMLENNHKKIGIITYPRKVFIFNERVKGFTDILKHSGIREVFIQEVPLKYKKIEETISESKEFILNSKVTAIFCVADSIAIFLSHVLLENKIKIPDEISVMGYDNLFYTNYFIPKLTTINHDMYEIGKVASENLIYRLEKGRFKNKKIIIDPILIPRDSVKKL